MSNDLIRIINHFTPKHQRIKLLEELGETTASLARYVCNPNELTLHNVKEELIDTMLLMEQFMIIHNVKKSEIHLMKEMKVSRTLERMKENENNFGSEI